MKNMAKREKKYRGREWYAKKRKRTKSKIRFTRRDDIRENEQDFWPKEKDWLIEKLVGTEKIPKKIKKT